MAGFVSRNELLDRLLGPHGLLGTVHSDAVASSSSPLAAMAATFYRNRTGNGQFIDFVQREAYMGHLGEIYWDSTSQ